ncbi:MAG: class II aldolase/adducin family protein [Kiritimatiellia bacterium]
MAKQKRYALGLTADAGRPVEGAPRPSSDTPTHLRLYKAFANIGGITHTHSAYATMFCLAGRPIPCLGTTHADTFHGEVPLPRILTAKEIESDYEGNTGGVIAERFKGLDAAAVPAVLVAGHAPFAWGKTPPGFGASQPDPGGSGPHGAGDLPDQPPGRAASGLRDSKTLYAQARSKRHPWAAEPALLYFSTLFTSNKLKLYLSW